MIDEYRPHVKGEVCTVYFSKSNLEVYQIFPKPLDLDNWYTFDVTDLKELDGTKYDPTTNTLIKAYPSNEDQLHYRQLAYKEESDSLYLEAQYDVRAGLKTEEEAYKPWVDKITEIKGRYPLYFPQED